MNRFAFISVLATAIFLCAFAPPVRAQNTLTALASSVLGRATIHGATGSLRPLKRNTVVREGDTLQLETKKSRVVLDVSDGTQIRLKGLTQVRFESLQAKAAVKKTRVTLAWGRIWAKVTKLANPASKFEIKAGGVVCGVRGTILGGEYDPHTQAGSFYNFEGLVVVDDGHGPNDIPQGFHAPFGGGVLGGFQPNGPHDGRNLGGPGQNPNNGSGSGGGAGPVLGLMGGLGSDPDDSGEEMLIQSNQLRLLMGFGLLEGGN